MPRTVFDRFRGFCPTHRILGAILSTRRHEALYPLVLLRHEFRPSCGLHCPGAAGTSGQAQDEGSGQFSSHGGDRVEDVALRSERERREVGNLGEGETAVILWRLVQRGEWLPARGSGSRKR